MTTQAEKHVFQAEVNEVLSIVVNSLYSNKEVFLRELISNASDALDKLSFLALTQHDLLSADPELRIELIPDREARTLTIRDNGIGMTREELIANLGTIARSGSKQLMKSLSEEQKKDLSLIGQFGVGFYSAYLVADRVTVVSRHAEAPADQPAWRWQSEAKGEFTIEPVAADPSTATLARGSTLVLHLREDEAELLQEWRLRGLVRKYSDYVRYPIRLWVEKEAAKDDKPAAHAFETVNTAAALWTRPKSEITDEQYGEFYKHLSHDWEPPLAWTHFKVEGAQELTGMLFVPSHPPMDLMERKPRGVRLFVKRVFIMDDCEELLPEWLRFMRGLIDSQDLPLNVSRELLQKDRTTQAIRKQIVSRSLALLEELAEEGETTRKDAEGNESTVNRYTKFYESFGRVLKEGIHYDHQNRERIAGLLRFHSSLAESTTSLKDYVARMPESQKAIYYVTADSLASARNSPHIEGLKQRGYEVLFLHEAVDEWVVESLHEFEGKPLTSAAKGALDLPESDAEKKARDEKQAELQPLLTRLQTALSEEVKEVRITDRLTESPACLVTDPHGLSPHLERLLRANGQEVPKQKRILELNASHPVVARLQNLAGEGGDDASFRQWGELLYDQAMLAEGALPADPARFARAVAKLMQDAAG